MPGSGEAEAAGNGRDDTAGGGGIAAQNGDYGVDIGVFRACKTAKLGDVRTGKHRFLIVDLKDGGIVLGSYVTGKFPT